MSVKSRTSSKENDQVGNKLHKEIVPGEKFVHVTCWLFQRFHPLEIFCLKCFTVNDICRFSWSLDQ